ncbi:MAG TPA: M48 family metalloprotease [Puia sp.]|nr:M48 family metalloprotease [Puia sp.]
MRPSIPSWLRHTLFNPILLFIGWVGSCPAALAQEKEFTPAAENAPLLANLLNQYQLKYKDDLNQLPSGNRKDYAEIYDARWKSIQEKFDKQEIYTAADAQDYLDKLVNVIAKGNPELVSHPFHCYFSRSHIPNASYMGEGIILFNMGLFERLTDESQAAFVLCHEISHYLLRHQEKSIDKYVTTLNSPEVQAQLRKIKGSEYRRREQLQDLLKGLTFDSRRHSRDHESEADSMAVELMRHTAFALTGATTTLALLDSVDEDRWDAEGYLQRVFNSSDYPFRKKWIAREEGLLGGHAHLKSEGQSGLADSLKTHPDCGLRIKLIEPLVMGGDASRAAAGSGGSVGAGGSSGSVGAFVVDPAKFRQLQERCRYEVIEYAYVSDEYTESLWLALELLQRRPTDGYAAAQVGKVLNALYQAQKGHTLGKVVDLPAPYYPENYNSLLQFVQNLYLADLASISYYFLKARYPELNQYGAFRKALEEAARNKMEQD